MSRTPLTTEAANVATKQHRLYEIFIGAGKGKKAPELQALIVQNPSAPADLLKEAFTDPTLRSYVLKNKAFLKDAMSGPFFAKPISDELHQAIFSSCDVETVLDTLGKVEVFNVYAVQNVLRNPAYSKALDVSKIDLLITNAVKALSLGDTMVLLGCLGSNMILSLSAASFNVQNLAVLLFSICLSKAEKRLDQLNEVTPKNIEAMLAPEVKSEATTQEGPSTPDSEPVSEATPEPSTEATPDTTPTVQE